jgi:hypothetical protein
MDAKDLTIEDAAKLRIKGRHFFLKDDGSVINFAAKDNQDPNWIYVAAMWDRLLEGPLTLEQAKEEAERLLNNKLKRLHYMQEDDYNPFVDSTINDERVETTSRKSKKARGNGSKAKLSSKRNRTKGAK